nr:MAG TPA: tail tape measure [Caudoviricetes sp.]
MQIFRKDGDKMSDGTSVGKIQLDLEISKSSISKELQGLSKVLSSGIQNTLSSSLSNMSGFFKNSVNNMFSGFKKFGKMGKSANDEVSKSVSGVNAKYEKTKEKIAQVNSELAKLYAQQDAIVHNYEGMPSFAGMSKDESMQQMLSRDKGYNQLGSEIDKLEAKLKGLTPELEQAKNKNEQLKDSVNKTNNSAKKASRGIKLFGDSAKKSEKKVGGFAAVINRSLMTVLRRVFIYSVILKAIRGIISYMNSALKTNKQFVSSLNTVRTNLRVAFQPIYDFILPALNALMAAVAKATTYIATAISSLFGKSYKESYDSAKGIETAKKAMDGYGASAKKAKNQVMGFDEVNVLDISEDEEDGSAGFEMEMPDTSEIDLTGIEKFKTLLQPTINSLKRLGDALQPLKDFAADSLKDFYNNFLVPVGKWTFGEGLPRFIDAITNGLQKINWQPIKDGLNNLWSALTPFAINVGEGLLWFWENILVPLGTWTMNEIVPRFLDILAGAIRILNEVIEILKPLGKWLWENFLKPLAEWTGGVIVSVLDGICDGLKGIGDWIGDHQGAVETMAIIAGSFAAAWGLVNVAVGAWNAIGVIATGVTSAFGAAVAFLTSPITIATIAIGAIIAVVVLLIKHWDEVKEAASKCWDWIVEKWNGAGEWFKTTVVEPVKKFFSDLWDGIKTKASESWEGIKGIWNTVSTWFNNTVIKPVSTFFSSLRDNIKNALSTACNWVKDIWNGAGNWFKGIGEDMFNGMWDGLKSVWESIESWVNRTVDWLKDKLTIWKSDKEEMESDKKGLGSSGGSGGTANATYNKNKQADISANKEAISAISKAKGVDTDTAYNMWKANSIPKLARGGIVDQPTLAMVGERGKEAVVPLENTSFIDKLASALANVLMMALNTGNSQQSSSSIADAIVNIDGTELARILIPKIDNELQRMGYRGILQSS